MRSSARVRAQRWTPVAKTAPAASLSARTLRSAQGLGGKREQDSKQQRRAGKQAASGRNRRCANRARSGWRWARAPPRRSTERRWRDWLDADLSKKARNAKQQSEACAKRKRCAEQRRGPAARGCQDRCRAASRTRSASRSSDHCAKMRATRSRRRAPRRGGIAAPSDGDGRGDQHHKQRERQRIVTGGDHQQHRGDQIGGERAGRHEVDLATSGYRARRASPKRSAAPPR